MNACTGHNKGIESFSKIVFYDYMWHTKGIELVLVYQGCILIFKHLDGDIT